MRIGTLLPRSTLFPSIGIDYYNGFKENLKYQNIFDEVKLFSQNIGFGVEEQQIYKMTEKMLLDDDVDIVILFAEYRIIEMMHPLFTASNKILLAVNFGANFPDSWQPAATTIVHTLNFSMHSGLTGKLAAQKDPKEAVMLTSYFDGGYRHIYTITATNAEAGGIPIFNHVTHIDPTQFTLEPLEKFLEENPAVKTMLCTFSGEQALKFYEAIEPLQKKFQLNLFGSPMLFDPTLKETAAEMISKVSIEGYVPWDPVLSNPANETYKQQASAINYFSLLGWETGLLIKELLNKYNSGLKKAADVVGAVGDMELESPRGRMILDKKTHHTYGPSYLVRYGFPKSGVHEMIEKTAWQEFIARPALQGEASGWRNTYLCA